MIHRKKNNNNKFPTVYKLTYENLTMKIMCQKNIYSKYIPKHCKCAILLRLCVLVSSVKLVQFWFHLAIKSFF